PQPLPPPLTSTLFPYTTLFRSHLPTIGLRLFDKSRQADIDVAHFHEQLRALRHRRPAAAMHKILVGRFRRREGVGLVQKAANGRSEEHTSELQSRFDLVCRLLL